LAHRSTASRRGSGSRGRATRAHLQSGPWNPPRNTRGERQGPGGLRPRILRGQGQGTGSRGRRPMTNDQWPMTNEKFSWLLLHAQFLIGHWSLVISHLSLWLVIPESLLQDAPIESSVPPRVQPGLVIHQIDVHDADRVVQDGKRRRSNVASLH